MSFPREKRENEEFYDEKFLTRKYDEKNEKLTGLKKELFMEKYRKKTVENRKKMQNLISEKN